MFEEGLGFPAGLDLESLTRCTVSRNPDPRKSVVSARVRASGLRLRRCSDGSHTQSRSRRSWTRSRKYLVAGRVLIVV
jgi:hypothetical protein